MKPSRIAAFAVCMLATAANATYNAVVTGSVEFVQQMAADTGSGYVPATFTFRLTNQPNINCGTFQYFSVSSVTVSDAQARKNILAILLQAKATGAQVQVAYDSTGGFCDQQMAGVYYVVLR